MREYKAEKNAEQEELFTAYAGERLESKMNVPKNIHLIRSPYTKLRRIEEKRQSLIRTLS